MKSLSEGLGAHISRVGLIYRTEVTHSGYPHDSKICYRLVLIGSPERFPISALLSLTLCLAAYFILHRPSWLDDIAYYTTRQSFCLVANVVYSLNHGQIFVEVFTQKGPSTYAIVLTKQKPLADMNPKAREVVR